MSALVKKEIRLLLPGFLIGVGLTLTNCFLGVGPGQGYANEAVIFCLTVVWPLMVVFTALNTFGAEVSTGTFSMLLALPVSRRRIWWTKVTLLAAALAAMYLMLCFSIYLHQSPLKRGLNVDFSLADNLFVIMGMFLLMVYSGALWTVLLLRQVAAAFWFTLLIPGAIIVFTSSLLGIKHSDLFTPVVVTAMGVYSVAGFAFAHRLFLRAQDVQWTGGNIALPEARGRFNILAGRGDKRCWRPKAALYRKELLLHQSQFILAGALLLMHLGVLTVRKFGSFQKNSVTEFVLDTFWILWLVMPVLVGCTAVAEERKLGTLQSQFCLPVKRRLQFGIKFRVVVLLSVLFGLVIPYLLEGVRLLPQGTQFSHETDPNTAWLMSQSAMRAFIWHCVGLFLRLRLVILSAGVVTSIGIISLYASTYARNTLQSLAPAVMGLLVSYTLFCNVYRLEMIVRYPLWSGPLICYTGIPVLAIVLVAMSYWNYQRLEIGWGVGRRNLLTFVTTLVLVVGATTAIYHRAWEYFTPFEPAHGAARLSLAKPAIMNADLDHFDLRLPDGRVWTVDGMSYESMGQTEPGQSGIKLTSLYHGRFLDGSNWAGTAIGMEGQRVGLKTDGTLWFTPSPTNAIPMADNRRYWMRSRSLLVQFGAETNWSSFIPRWPALWLVKNDGTLWKWGPTNWNYKRTDWPGYQAYTPERLGSESNWAGTFLDNSTLFLRKTDGSLWRPWHKDQDTEAQRVQIGPKISFTRSSLPDSSRWRGLATIWHGKYYRFSIRDDGTFRLRAIQDIHAKSLEWSQTDRQIGSGTNWLGLAASGSRIVTLKDDGTLWSWNFPSFYRRGMNSDPDLEDWLNTPPVRLGIHSDWLAVGNLGGTVVSFAADGSLWAWQLDHEKFYPYPGEMYAKPLLDESRKPHRLASIFDEPAGPDPLAMRDLSPDMLTELARRIPIPANPPVTVSLLSVSNAADGSRTANYSLSNHTAKAVQYLGDSKSRPFYSLIEYLPDYDQGGIMATNHHQAFFIGSHPISLAAESAIQFPVQIPAGVTNALLYINYINPKSDWDEWVQGWKHDIKVAMNGQETSTGTAVPYENYPLPTPFDTTPKK